ncbi:MAG: PAC2 family protein [Anaerolineae bacterium]|nr:PAC2 family protein [Anaerolineae bacterium]
MNDIVELLEQPESQELYMIVGWRQWADAGSTSSGLPQYLIEQTNARRIGTMKPDGFYMFQIPGTHDLVRPIVEFTEGYPETLEFQRNEFFYSGTAERGMMFFVGDEPHLDIERYISAILDTAEQLGVRRIISLGGVYGELPYHRERTVSCIYSLAHLRDEVAGLAVTLSDYVGGASIDSYLCRRAGDRGMEHVGFYAFVPTYDFTDIEELGNGIRIENDFMAWRGVMQRVNFMLKLGYDLTELSEKTAELIQVMDAKIEQLDKAAPQVGLREYFDRLNEDFEEVTFDPLDDVWEEELRKLFDDDSDPAA